MIIERYFCRSSIKVILKVLMRLANEHLQYKFYKNIIKIIPKLSSIITKYAHCLLYECRDAYIWALIVMRKPIFWILTWYDMKQPVQPQWLTIGLNFLAWQLDVLIDYLGRECLSDRQNLKSFVVGICKKSFMQNQVFSQRGPIQHMEELHLFSLYFQFQFHISQENSLKNYMLK